MSSAVHAPLDLLLHTSLRSSSCRVLEEEEEQLHELQPLPGPLASGLQLNLILFPLPPSILDSITFN